MDKKDKKKEVLKNEAISNDEVKEIKKKVKKKVYHPNKGWYEVNE